MILLSIVMPAVIQRFTDYTPKIYQQLQEQTDGEPQVEVLTLMDNGRMSIGRKMDLLYEMARGRFIAGVADDDEITQDYVSVLLRAIKENPEADVISFDHDYYHDGEFYALIKESIHLPYSNNRNSKVYTRSPSPKCAIRAVHCKGFKHPDVWHGEDTAFMKYVLPLLRTEVKLDQVLYIYLYDGRNKRFRANLAEIGAQNASV